MGARFASLTAYAFEKDVVIWSVSFIKLGYAVALLLQSRFFSSTGGHNDVERFKKGLQYYDDSGSDLRDCIRHGFSQSWDLTELALLLGPSRNISRIFYSRKISLTIFFDCSGYFFKEPYATYRKYNRTDRHLFRHFSGNLFKSCLEGV